MLWHSFGTTAALLQEIINIYPAINPPQLTVSISLVVLRYLNFECQIPILMCVIMIVQCAALLDGVMMQCNGP